MKRVLLSSCLLFFALAARSQCIDVGYIFFDEKSPETYIWPYNSNLVKKYQKNVGKKGYIDEMRISFYVENEMFTYDPSKKHSVDTCNISQLKGVSLLYDDDLDQLKKKYCVGNLGRPGIFKKLYIVEKLSSSIYVLYEVEWEDVEY